MNNRTCISAFATVILSCSIGLAQTSTTSAPAAKLANATGICKDGTYSTAASKSGACRGHHGVQEWYADAAATAAKPSAAAPSARAAATAAQPSPATQPAAAAAPAAGPSPTTQVRTQNQAAAQSAGQSSVPPATQSIKKGPAAEAANAAVAPGGAPNLVWVNTASNVYHCPGTDFYGKTKKGAYMTEADAKAKGARGNRGKTCSK